MDEKRITRQEDIPEGVLEDRGFSGEILESTLDGDVDVPDSLEEWVEETKGFQRVARVAMSLTEPKSAKWISEQALVSEQAAREHLEFFADLSIVAFEVSGTGTRYYADQVYLHHREVAKARKDYTKEEISELVEELAESIDEIKSKFEVDTPSQLRVKASEQDDAQSVRKYMKAASRWESFKDQQHIYSDALRSYERFADKEELTA